jgi:RNA polymerase sigma factor (sigma-70 family)
VIDFARLRGLVEIMAAERTRDHPELFDDAVQEGMIAAWRAHEARGDRSPAYYHAAARHGVLSVLRGRHSFGHEGRRGWQDAHDSSVPLVVRSEDGEESMVADPEAIWAQEEVESGPRFAEIRRAVAELDPEDRAIVFGRYWLDVGYAELADSLGRPAGTLSRRWSEKIRPLLAERIAA